MDFIIKQWKSDRVRLNFKILIPIDPNFIRIFICLIRFDLNLKNNPTHKKFGPSHAGWIKIQPKFHPYIQLRQENRQKPVLLHYVSIIILNLHKILRLKSGTYQPIFPAYPGSENSKPRTVLNLKSGLFLNLNLEPSLFPESTKSRFFWAFPVSGVGPIKLHPF